MKYFDIHVVEDLDRGLGYSVFLKTDKNLSVEQFDEIIAEAMSQNLIDDEDAKYVDNIYEIDEEEFVLATA